MAIRFDKLKSARSSPALPAGVHQPSGRDRHLQSARRPRGDEDPGGAAAMLQCLL